MRLLSFFSSSSPFICFLLFLSGIQPLSAQQAETLNYFSEHVRQSIPAEVRAVMKKPYHAARPFSKGRSAVMLDGKWGFIDNKGNEILPPIYDLVCDFWAASTMVKKENRWHLVNAKGELIKAFDIDFFDGFRNGLAKIYRKGKMALINPAGEIQHPGWVTEADGRRPAPSVSTDNINVGCPANIDFEFGDFRNWTSRVGRVQCTNNVNTLTMNIVNPPVASHLEMINNVPAVFDPYGPIPVRPFDGSLYALKIGDDNDESSGRPDRYAESVEYLIDVPPAPANFNIIYDYAVVLEEPDTSNTPHLACERPKFTIEIIDALTNQTVPCGFLEYTADSITVASGGFIRSAISPQNPSAINFGGIVWYKPWSSVFVNLSRFAGRQIKVVFTARDCTLSGHWGYAYLDIRGCQTVLNAYNTCTSPVRTILDGPPGFSIYKWYDANYTTLLSTNRYQVLNNPLPAGSTVHLIYSLNSSSACLDTLNAVVTNGRSDWSAGPDTSVCDGGSVVIGSAPVPNFLYAWSPATYLSGVNTGQVTANPPVGITYTVTATDTSTGCIINDTVNVMMGTRPSIRVNDITICEGQSGTLVATGASDYSWVPAPTLTVNPQNVAQATVNPSINTSYIVRGSNNASGCYGADTAFVTVSSAPSASITGPASFTLCQGQTVSLQAQSSAATSIQWYFDDPADANPPAIIPGATSFDYEAAQSGVYYAVVSNAAGCKDTATHPLQLQFYPKPAPSFSFPATCLGNPVAFTNTSTVTNAGPVTYQWNFGDGSAPSSAFNPTHTYAAAGNYTVTLSIIPALCPSIIQTASDVVIVEAPVPGVRYPDVYTVRNSNRQLQARTFAVEYLWAPAMGLSNPGISNPRFNYTRDMKYLIRLVTAAGCETVDTQFVYLRAAIDIRVPTGFSPNGDGHNDVLDIFLIDIVELKWFRVFNRWGQLLFETNDPRQRWDGTFKGVKQPAETYVWTAQGVGVDGSEVIRRGQCVLLR